MIDVRRLRLLAELEARGTIAAVGAALHLSPPGVSTQLSALEREVGLDLTEKDGRRIRLTPAGRRLAAHARVVLDQLEVIASEIAESKQGRRGRFRVGAFSSAARTIVAETWRSLLDSGSEVTMILHECEPDQAIPSLACGELDLAITHSYSNVPRAMPPEVEAVSLASETVWLAVRQDDVILAGSRRSVDLRSMSERPWVVPHAELSCYDMVQRACAAAGFVPRVVAEATDFSVLTSLVAAGVGVALIPDLTIDHLPRAVRLVRLQDPIQRHDFILTRQTAATDPALGVLRDEIIGAAQRVMVAAERTLNE